MAFPDMVGTCDRRHVAGDVLLEDTWTATHTGVNREVWSFLSDCENI